MNTLNIQVAVRQQPLSFHICCFMERLWTALLLLHIHISCFAMLIYMRTHVFYIHSTLNAMPLYEFLGLAPGQIPCMLITCVTWLRNSF